VHSLGVAAVGNENEENKNGTTYHLSGITWPPRLKTAKSVKVTPVVRQFHIPGLHLVVVTPVSNCGTPW
jgi:hypothetical protein